MPIPPIPPIPLPRWDDPQTNWDAPASRWVWTPVMDPRRFDLVFRGDVVPAPTPLNQFDAWPDNQSN